MPKQLPMNGSLVATARPPDPPARLAAADPIAYSCLLQLHPNTHQGVFAGSALSSSDIAKHRRQEAAGSRASSGKRLLDSLDEGAHPTRDPSSKFVKRPKLSDKLVAAGGGCAMQTLLECAEITFVAYMF